MAFEAVVEGRHPNEGDFKRAGLKGMLRKFYGGNAEKAVEDSLASGYIDFRIIRGD